MSFKIRKLKESITYHEKYKRQAKIIAKEFLPKTMPHISEGCAIKRIEVMGAGIVNLAGAEMEFQDLRVYVNRPGK